MDVFIIRDDDDFVVLDVPEGVSDLAGFESWRRTIWGSDTVRSLGAEFLPQLKCESWVRIPPHKVWGFMEEIALLQNNLELIAMRQGDARKSFVQNVYEIGSRLNNFHAAAQRALSIRGGVIIW
ncbi:hypothetical protein [Mycobacteroides immunogenum]|uniref:hypothetical protein n=1 Tax=Mycobacteroides immunogenum TaxID=83262 RepID=UPI001969E1A6|nr:hypothetical protein [Mycobacteroides immunogenum]